MSKYIDLIGQITERLDVPCGNIRLGIHEALAYLDRYPDQVPGRTITWSDYQRLMDDTSMPYGVGFTDGFHQAGGSIIPDPEPTNAEKLEALLEGGDINAQWGLRGGGVMFARELAHALDEAGVKAPGGGE